MQLFLALKMSKFLKDISFMMVHMPYVIIPPSELKELGDSSPLPEHLKQVYPILHMGQIPQDGENGQNMAF